LAARKNNANEGCNSCASLAGLSLQLLVVAAIILSFIASFIACFILLVIAPLTAMNYLHRAYYDD